jgi:hypothetical protein
VNDRLALVAIGAWTLAGVLMTLGVFRRVR